MKKEPTGRNRGRTHDREAKSHRGAKPSSKAWLLLRPALGGAALLLGGPAIAQNYNAEAPNGEGQKPAFENQTRAPTIQEKTKLKTTVVAGGLVNPWGMAELPDGGWLVTEKPGRMRMVAASGTLGKPIAGLPDVHAQGQGGLLDVAVRDDFASTRRVWWSYAEPRGSEGNGTAVATGVLSADGAGMSDVKVIFRQMPSWRSNLHYGSRLVFDRNSALFVTTGERSNPESRVFSQDVKTHLGKVIRIKPEGGPADGNPSISGGQPEIWSYGHRNLQAATLGPDGALWTVEHGPRGGDELNRPEAGKNYGWPVITYGIEYSGRPVGKGETAQSGLEQPIYYWDPVIGPSGMVFYEGAMFPEWRGSILVGGLVSRSLVRLTVENGKVTGESRPLSGTGRIRDVAVARDGAVMVLTDAPNGALIRVTPES
jgi:aldose sugar dehydrogenase